MSLKWLKKVHNRTYKNNREWYKERLSALGFKNYKEYLASDIWRLKKREFYQVTKARVCFVCNSDKELNVHHRRYKRIGQENVKKDLVLLCRDCHYRLHNKLKENSNLQLWSVHRRMKKEENRLREVLIQKLLE